MPDARPPIEMINGVPVAAAPDGTEASNVSLLRTVLVQGAWFAVDMTRTQLLNSAAIGVLVIPASAAVLRLAALTGLDRMIPDFTALEPEPTAVPPPTPIAIARKARDAHQRALAADRPRRSWTPGPG